MTTIALSNLAVIVGGQQATPGNPSSTSTTGPTVPDPDEEWREHQRWLDQPAPWNSCAGGFWTGCTNRDRYQ